VQDPAIVDVLQRNGQLHKHGHGLALEEAPGRLLPPSHRAGEVPAVGVLHDDAQPRIDQQSLVVGDDVRVGQRLEDLCFPQSLRPMPLVSPEVHLLDDSQQCRRPCCCESRRDRRRG